VFKCSLLFGRSLSCRFIDALSGRHSLVKWTTSRPCANHMEMTFQDLQNPMRWTFLFHALCGVVALGVLLIPLFSKKGGRLHIRAGWVYIYAMIIVCFSAFIITPWRVLFDEQRTIRTQGFSVFLFFIAVFTLSALYFGVISLRFKQRDKPSKALGHIAPPIMLIAFGIITQVIGAKLGSTLRRCHESS